MSVKSTLSFSPLTNRVYWGRVNQSTGIASGEQKDVTSEFLHVMELKFPVNTAQTITGNGKPLFRVVVVDMDKEVIVNGKVLEG